MKTVLLMPATIQPGDCQGPHHSVRRDRLCPRKLLVEKLSERIIDMKPLIRMFLATLFVFVLGSPPSGHAQTTTQKTTSKAATPSEADIQKKNVQSYIDLLAFSTSGASPSRSASAPFPIGSTRPRKAGQRKPIPNSFTTTDPRKADTSRRGSSRSCSLRTSERRSDRCANWREADGARSLSCAPSVRV